MELVIVTGLSGAGKTTAIRCLEDMGYYCVDNIPPRLMIPFIDMARNSSDEMDKVAFVIDIRGKRFFDDAKGIIDELRADESNHVKIVFLEASNETLIRRYKETRRNHPLAVNGDINKGIEEERKLLSFVKSGATLVIDTTSFKSSQFKLELMKLLDEERQDDAFVITISSFGFKYGIPLESDWVWDMRFLPNPYYVPGMKSLTGNNKKVYDYVMNTDQAKEFLDKVTGLVNTTIPSYINEGKYGLFIAIGCTGGRHRSVAMANAIAEKLKSEGKHVNLVHRDIEK